MIYIIIFFYTICFSESPSICETDAGYCVPKLVTDDGKDDGNVPGTC